MNMKRTCLFRHGDVMPAVGPNARTYGETTVGAGNAEIDLELIRYEGFEPQPFDLARDPEERDDLAARGTHRHVLDLGRRKLGSFLDPAEVNRRAFADQRALIERHDGERGLLDRMHLYFDYTPMSPEAAGRG